jgi:hypothetical protein
MRIPLIRVSSCLDEWAIIELQGSVISKIDSFEGLSIGPLKIEQDRANLIIGNHELQGKVQKLKRPLIVLKRGSMSEIPVVAIVQSKIVFQERPMLTFPK